MLTTTKIALFAAAAVAAGAISAPTAHARIETNQASATDFSAQQKKKGGPGPQVAPRSAPRAAPHMGGGGGHAGPRSGPPRVMGSPQRTIQRNTVQQRNIQPNVMQRRTIQPNAVQRNVSPRTAGPRIGSSNNAGARVLSGARMRNMPVGGAGRAMIRGRNFSVWRGNGYRVRHGGGWRTFVALGTLGALTVGAVSYYPYAYLSAPQPYCEGLTEDGCELSWQNVQTIEGDVVGQCVSYCPWQ